MLVVYGEVNPSYYTTKQWKIKFKFSRKINQLTATKPDVV